MDVKLNEEQIQLRDTARKFMTEACTADFIREIESGDVGYSKDMWRQMAAMGWLGIGLPEAVGGLGMETVDMVILAKELGRRVCPSPFVSTVLLGAEAIARAGNDAQKAKIESIIDGETIVSWAYQGEGRKFDPGYINLEARADGDGFVLNGSKMFVEYAPQSDLMIVVSRTSGAVPSPDGLTMFLVDPKSAGITTKHLPSIARDHQYKVEFSDVRVAKEDVLGAIDGAAPVIAKVIEKAVIVFSGFCVGVSEQMHEWATQFAKDRVQFSRPIGQMQYIQNYLATLIIQIYGIDTLTLFTAFNYDKGRDVEDLVAKTKAFSAITVKDTTDIGSQIFGGMGYMEEQDSTLYLRRGRLYRAMFGDVDYWEEKIAAKLLD